MYVIIREWPVIRTCLGYDRLGIVGHHNLWAPIKVAECRSMTVAPRFGALIPKQICEGEIASTQVADEEKHRRQFSPVRICDEQSLASKVGESCVSGFVILAHHQIQAFLKSSIQVTELRLSVNADRLKPFTYNDSNMSFTPTRWLLKISFATSSNLNIVVSAHR